MQGIRFVKELGGVKEYRLVKNGLKILLLPKGIGEAIAFLVHYNVGSRNEGVGHTGAAHALEHLLFCGSKSFFAEGQSVFDLFSFSGAFANANTNYDDTKYYEVCLPESLSACVAIEADRMRNAIFGVKHWKEEREIVRNEFEMGENSQPSRLRKLVTATAISEHPYHHPVIGWGSDINAVAVERIRQFYDTFYYPNNATVIVAGNFQEREVLKMILANFGKIEPSPHQIPQVHTKEPPQQGERRVVLRGPGESGTIILAWRAPAGSSPEFAALLALVYALTRGRRSFLQQEFVVPGRAHEIYAGLSQLKDPFLFFLTVKLFGRAEHEEMEKNVRAFLSRLADKGIGKEHLKRAKRLAEADFVYAGDGLLHLVMQLSHAEGVESWQLWHRLMNRLRGLNTGELMRVFRDYFKDDALTVGWFVPQDLLVKETCSKPVEGGDV